METLEHMFLNKHAIDISGGTNIYGLGLFYIKDVYSLFPGSQSHSLDSVNQSLSTFPHREIVSPQLGPPF